MKVVLRVGGVSEGRAEGGGGLVKVVLRVGGLVKIVLRVGGLVKVVLRGGG